MRTSNGARATNERASRRALGIALAGGAAVFVLAGGGIAIASTMPGYGVPDRIGIRANWNRVSNAPGAGIGKSGRPSAPTSAPAQGQPGWNRVSNTPGTTPAPGTSAPGSVTTGGRGGRGLPGSTPTPGPVTTGGQGGQADLGGQGGQGGQGGVFPGTTGGQGGLAD
jgi:hypothetical protein